jgi:hypothetical protein
MYSCVLLILYVAIIQVPGGAAIRELTHTQCTAFSINVINLIKFVRFITNDSDMLLRYCRPYKHQQLIPDYVPTYFCGQQRRMCVDRG